MYYGRTEPRAFNANTILCPGCALTQLGHAITTLQTSQQDCFYINLFCAAWGRLECLSLCPTNPPSSLEQAKATVLLYCLYITGRTKSFDKNTDPTATPRGWQGSENPPKNKIEYDNTKAIELGTRTIS